MPTTTEKKRRPAPLLYAKCPISEAQHRRLSNQIAILCYYRPPEWWANKIDEMMECWIGSEIMEEITASERRTTVAGITLLRNALGNTSAEK